MLVGPESLPRGNPTLSFLHGMIIPLCAELAFCAVLNLLPSLCRTHVGPEAYSPPGVTIGSTEEVAGGPDPTLFLPR